MSGALFNYPEIPDSSVGALQVGPNVEALAVGDEVLTEYGPGVILSIEVSKWRFSEKPKHRLTFRLATGENYSRSYHPAAPLIHNQEEFFGHPVFHSRFRRCYLPGCDAPTAVGE